MKTGEGARYEGLIYDSFILLLSLLSVANLAISVLSLFQPDIVEVVVAINLFLSVVFFGDFLYRFVTADAKVEYLIRNGGWADLLSSVPLTGMKVFRIYRIVDVGMRSRKFKAERMADELSVNRAHAALFSIIIWIILITEVASILILHVERYAAEASILSAGDAIWWSVVTITTVGYGDLYPVTSAGRIIAVVLMISGVGVFATLAGFLSTRLVTPKDTKDESPDDTPDGDGSNLGDIGDRLDAQQEMMAAILRQVERAD